MILIGAIVIGAIAAFGLLTYIRGIEDDKYAESELVDVLIVKQDIPRNTTGDDAINGAFIVRDQIPIEFAPNNRLTTEDQIKNLVAVNDISVNQVLVPGLFVSGEESQASFDLFLQGDNVAMSMSFDQVRAVGGFLKPGDEVNMLLTGGGLTDEETLVEVTAEGETEPDLGPYPNVARVLYQRVRILAIGDQLPLQPGQTPTDTIAPTGAGIITFQVPMEAAIRLASAESGSIQLVLVPDDYVAEPIPPLTADEITGELPGEDPSRLTPYGPDGLADQVDEGIAFGDDTETDEEADAEAGDDTEAGDDAEAGDDEADTGLGG